MILQDKGFLISNNKYNENSSIAEFYTKNYGKLVGVIFGASSKKLKNYLLIGNKFHINCNNRDNGKIGYFKVEIDQIKTPIFLENKQKLHCIIYTMNLIKILTVENQQNIEIYKLIEDFFDFLKEDIWLNKFVLWELKILKNIGYEIDFKNYVNSIETKGNKKFVVNKNNKIIPNFLINQDEKPVNKDDIINGFKIVGDFLDKSIIKPNNLNFPSSRLEFVNLI